jgi:hypothetical protein
MKIKVKIYAYGTIPHHIPDPGKLGLKYEIVQN